MKADLHMHGPIGFQDYWIKIQGYQGKNLGKLFVDNAIKNKINICAITSEETEIPKGTIHDRFNYIFNEINKIPKEYRLEKLGKKDIAFIVERKKDRNEVIFLNSQTVLTKEKDSNNYIDHLIIGSNQISNGLSLKETLKQGNDSGLIQIAEHPLAMFHQGMGEYRLIESIDNYDAIEGFNSQFIFPEVFKGAPVFGSFCKSVNKETQKISEECGKPWIATSDAHRIEDIGKSNIEINNISFSNEESLINNLKTKIRTNNFNKNCNYENVLDWINWVSKFSYYTYIKKQRTQ